MFKWIKKLFGVTESKSLPSTDFDTDLSKIIEEKQQEIKKLTNPVKEEKRAAKAAKKSSKKYTKEDLEKMDKAAIDRLAANELDLKLDRRKKKETLIEEFLAAQK